MYYLQFYPGSWERLALTIMGLLIVVLAVVSTALMFARRSALAEGIQALAGGVCIGLAGEMAGGIGFLALQSRVGGPDFFLAPYDMRAGLLCGLGLGMMSLLAIGAYIALPSAAAGGLLGGALAGLGIFRLIFGPTAGFGGEVGLGVGSEVGIMFGAAGGMLGAIVGSIVSLATGTMRPLPSHAPTDAPPTTQHAWRWPVIGLTVGALGATLIGVLGSQMGYFQFLVPYNAQIPDVAPDTSPAGMQRNFLFGLGMFAVGGALIGCFLGLQWLTSSTNRARRRSVWFGAGIVVALITGLSFGLAHRYVGGPLLATQLQIPPDPVASVRGLLVGLGGGVAVGALLLIVTRISAMHARWRIVASMTPSLLIGLLLLALPYWYVSVSAISIY